MNRRVMLLHIAVIITVSALISVILSIGTVSAYDIYGVCVPSEWADKFICIDNTYADEIMAFSYKCLPAKVRDEVTVVVIEDEILKGHEDIVLDDKDGYLTGLYDNRNNFIYVKDDKYSAKDSMIHEMGHCIDRNRGFVSAKDEFLYIYETEAEMSGLSDYGVSCASEYFAEAFRAYLTGGCEYRVLSRKAPETFEYMEKFIEGL